MLACTETVTLIHHIAEDNGDKYVCFPVYNKASWFAKITIATSADGAKPVNTYDVRIMDALEGKIPELGDYCVKGIVEHVTKPADLKGLEYFRITAIGKNFRSVLPHWRVSGQ
jgi:hypothetical protein